jgi:hypothetical protein
MKLSELPEQPIGYGAARWARARAGEAVKELALPEEDPIVAWSFSIASQDDPWLRVTLWAALTVGFATVLVTSDPVSSTSASITIAVEGWAIVRSSLRLDSSGDAEDGLPAVTIAAGSARITSTTRHDRVVVLDLSKEGARQAGRAGWA